MSTQPPVVEAPKPDQCPTWSCTPLGGSPGLLRLSERTETTPVAIELSRRVDRPSGVDSGRCCSP